MATEQLSKRGWGMLLVLCGALFLDALDVSMTGVALPSIGAELEMSTSSLQWVVSGCVLGFGAAVALLAAFVAIERRVRAPLVRLGILRSRGLVRANLGAMSLFGGWVGILFVATLYMQELRGWSALATGMAVFPAGVVVVLLTPYVARLVARFGVTRVILAGLSAHVLAYALFLSIGLNSSYLPFLLATFLLVGVGFGLAYGPLNIAATNGVASEEQGLASGLVTTSFQFGGALVLAVVTAVNNAVAGADPSPQLMLDGFHAAAIVSLVAVVLGAAATALEPVPLEQEACS